MTNTPEPEVEDFPQDDQPPHDYAALAAVLERRDDLRAMPIFLDNHEWLTALTIELGKAASQVEQGNFTIPVTNKLRELIIGMAALSLGWLDHLQSPNAERSKGGLLIRRITEDYGPPEGLAERIKEELEKRDQEQANRSA